MNTRTLTLACVAALTMTVAAGCTDQDVDRVADALRSASRPAPAETGAAVDVEQARRHLAALTVAPEGPSTGYDRALFPHWSRVDGACDTREMVLREQGTDVRVDSRCRPVSGTWTSPYDGQMWTDASDVDIDHMVPLAEAWKSGASAWTTAHREAFANDLDSPQLIAVTDNVNQAKGDQDPSTWQPSVTSYRCTYAADWVGVKSAWHLTADQAEVDALQDMLDTCGAGGAK